MTTAKNIRRPAVNLLGLKVNRLVMDQVLEAAEHHIKTKQQLLLGVVNVAKLVRARKDTQLQKSLQEADLVLADGLPIVWLSRLIGKPLPQRVAGIDIMNRLLEKACEKNYSVYLLGAKPKALEVAVRVIRQKYRGLHIAGFRDGYFNEDQERQVAEDIRNIAPDILFVAISSPKKENFLRKWHRFMNVSVCHGVGGGFDVLAGFKKRAPVWMQKHGLEWFYRLIQEPRRMWKRYLVTNSIFILLSLIAIARGREE